MQQNLSLPSKFQGFFEPHRYKVAYGGRGSGKSWSIATALVLKSLEKPTRVLCVREVQKSILDSCLQLLSDTIYRLGVESEFDIQVTQILGKNGSRFIFEGLKANVSKIKSMEGIDIVWAEEADQVTATSWNTLIPTIRKPNSEIWVSFNPADEMDDTYQRFVTNPPDDSYVVKVNYSDNPWFPPELEKERLAMKSFNETLYQHIWEGEPVANRDGAYWAKYINAEQITNIPVEPNIPVSTYWDLGVSDSTAIWFVQQAAGQIRVLHSYENHGEGLAHYVNYIHDWRDKHQAVMGQHYAPHDIAVRELGSGKSRLETARQMGISFQIAPNVSVDDGIQAARAIMPRCWFDKTHCVDGLRALRSYRKEFDDAKGIFKTKPLHDWCFTADTKVLTRNGMQQIIDLPETGEVYTLCGWKQYTQPRLVKQNAPLVEVKFKDGHTVRCTPDHLFLTASGWKYAENLAKHTEVLSCLTSSQSTLMGACTGFIRKAISILQRAVKDCIGQYGRLRSARFREDAIFTTGMEIGQTTASRTLNASMVKSICSSLGMSEPSLSEKVRVGFLIKQDQRQQNGTDQMRAAYGTADTPSDLKAGLNGKELRSLANGAAISTWLSSGSLETHKDFAILTAKQPTIEIESVKSLNYVDDVWCLTVPDGGNFCLENGAVVHNCSHYADAFRYFALCHRDINTQWSQPVTAGSWDVFAG